MQRRDDFVRTSCPIGMGGTPVEVARGDFEGMVKV
jgi:hypothetical protein